MNRVLSVLFWAVIAAAFIGPGTVTTAASAGASFGMALLWALAFSTIACIVLQEAAGRLRLLSGHSLGGALGERFPSGVRRWLVVVLVVGSVLVGNAAYEAGNILGGVAGAALLVDWPAWLLTLGCGVVVASLLWFNAPGRVAQVLGVVVAVMGLAFLAVAIALRPSAEAFLQGLLVPAIPPGSGVLVLGLVGTTVVPYNLFLGSGLSRDEDLSELRFGLVVAILLGGLISMGILVVGTQVVAPFTFDGLAAALEARLGGWAPGLLGVGLFCAGLSSAITAPLASALAAQSLFAGKGDAKGVWSSSGVAYRAVWGGVLAAGLAFGLSGVRPVPVIILAQALNGIVLPVVAVFLLLAVNDRRLMGSKGLNGFWQNTLMIVVTLVALLLGVVALTRVAANLLGTAPLAMGWTAGLAAGVAALVAWPLAAALRSQRGSPTGEADEQR